MRPTLFLFGTLLLAAFAGCVTDDSGTADLESVYGSGTVVDVNGTAILTVQALEGRFVGNGTNDTWAPVTNMTLEVAPMTLEKVPPGPEGGGGVTTALLVGAGNLSLEVRIMKADELDGHRARWALVTGPMDNLTWTEARDPQAPYAVPVNGLGTWVVVVQFERDGDVEAITGLPFVGTIQKVHWAIDSSVQPIKGPAPTYPENYDAMADVFTVEVPPSVFDPYVMANVSATITAVTTLQDPATERPGADVALELVDPQGGYAACSDSGGQGSGTVPPDPSDPPDPRGFSDENVMVPDADAGTWSVRVGGAKCPAFGDTQSYGNPEPVSYHLDLTLEMK